MIDSTSIFSDGLGGNGLAGGEEFDFFGMLDFPDFAMEDVDVPIDGFVGNDDFLADSESFGPIPSNVDMGPLMGGTPDPKQLPYYSDDVSGSLISPPDKITEILESGPFQTQSSNSELESSGSCSTGKSLAPRRLPFKPEVAVPRRTRSKRVRNRHANPWSLMPPFYAPTSTFKKSSYPRKNKEKKKKTSRQSVSIESIKVSSNRAENPQQGSGYNEVQSTSSKAPKKCAHCEITKTPQWRAGPAGPKTLCNACGVRYRSGRLFPEYRPAASPTFVPLLHSNSHKKVVEMRKTKPEAASVVEAQYNAKPEQGSVVPVASFVEPPYNAKLEVLGIDVPLLSPLPEFIPNDNYPFDDLDRVAVFAG